MLGRLVNRNVELTISSVGDTVGINSSDVGEIVGKTDGSHFLDKSPKSLVGNAVGEASDEFLVVFLSERRLGATEGTTSIVGAIVGNSVEEFCDVSLAVLLTVVG
jgi:hypothetical protein